MIAWTSGTSEAERQEQSRKLQDFQKGLSQELEAELVRFFGEDRLRRFKAAGILQVEEEE
ncbi:MAG TPA: hypothetical protein VL171_02890 [Verrucomicrobiae bacterium]|nr:hypothetical protein [Verrucomicrobiae bacterium]